MAGRDRQGPGVHCVTGGGFLLPGSRQLLRRTGAQPPWRVMATGCDPVMIHSGPTYHSVKRPHGHRQSTV